MKWKINRQGCVEDESGSVVCILPENSPQFESDLIKYAPVMFDAILDFLQSVDTTTHPRNPKKHHDKFQKIIAKITGDE